MDTLFVIHQLDLQQFFCVFLSTERFTTATVRTIIAVVRIHVPDAHTKELFIINFIKGTSVEDKINYPVVSYQPISYSSDE